MSIRVRGYAEFGCLRDRLLRAFRRRKRSEDWLGHVPGSRPMDEGRLTDRSGWIITEWRSLWACATIGPLQDIVGRSQDSGVRPQKRDKQRRQNDLSAWNRAPFTSRGVDTETAMKATLNYWRFSNPKSWTEAECNGEQQGVTEWVESHRVGTESAAC